MTNVEAKLRTKLTASERRVGELEKILRVIAGGHISKDNGGPDAMALSKIDFRHEMWTWSQKIAREAIAKPTPPESQEEKT